MAMRSKIPDAIREQLANDPWMKRCILEGDLTCEGRIEWNHGMTYAGRRTNELYSLIPMCHHHHVIEASVRPHIENAIRERIRHFHAEKDFRAKYPKSNLLPKTANSLV